MEEVQLIFSPCRFLFFIWDGDLCCGGNMGIFSFLRRHQRTLIPTGETRTKSPAPIQSTLRDEVQCVLAKAFNLTLTFGRFKATHAWLFFSS